MLPNVQSILTSADYGCRLGVCLYMYYIHFQRFTSVIINLDDCISAYFSDYLSITLAR